MIDHKSFIASRASLQGPAYRWLTAHDLTAGKLPKKIASGDPLVREAYLYLRQHAAGIKSEEDIAKRFPQVAAARALTHNHAVADQLRILVLGNCTPEMMAARLNVDVNTILMWEQLFFAVRERRDAAGWVLVHVMMPEEKANPAMAARMKSAYAGGPVVAEAVLDSEAGALVNTGERLFEHTLQLNMKFRAALDAPMETARERVHYLKAYFELVQREQRLELDRKRLEHRSQESLRKHEVAQERLKLLDRKLRIQEERLRNRTLERATNVRDKQLQATIDAVAAQRMYQADMRAAAARRAARERRADTSPLAELSWQSSEEPRQENLGKHVQDRHGPKRQTAAKALQAVA